MPQQQAIKSQSFIRVSFTFWAWCGLVRVWTGDGKILIPTSPPPPSPSPLPLLGHTFAMSISHLVKRVSGNTLLSDKLKRQELIQFWKYWHCMALKILIDHSIIIILQKKSVAVHTFPVFIRPNRRQLNQSFDHKVEKNLLCEKLAWAWNAESRMRGVSLRALWSYLSPFQGKLAHQHIWIDLCTFVLMVTVTVTRLAAHKQCFKWHSQQ